jgi:uncharacterized protein
MGSKIGVAAVAVAALSIGATAAVAERDRNGGQSGQSRDTRADYTPFEEFSPLASSSNCPGAPSGDDSEPYVLPPGYAQAIVAEESDPVVSQPPEGDSTVSEDLWDMNTQNEFGKDAGRYLYRTHEVGSAPPEADPETPGGGQVTVTDLKTGLTKNLADRNDWERFDGITWTPWGTILVAEEVIVQSARDPQVPQAEGGLVYELFVDKNDPSRLDPSREPITPGDGTNDTVQDGVRARPALGAKSHEGLRFDKRGFLYGIAESRGETNPAQSGAIFRFVPDEKGDLSSGVLSAYDSPNGKDGAGQWLPLDRDAVQVNADEAAAAAEVNRYERPEDVETGQSTGKDRLNGGNTLYVAITDNAGATNEEGVLNIDLSRKEQPFGYRYVGAGAGNASEPDFNAPDNLALDRSGNLAITEDGGGNGDDIFIAAPPNGHGDGDDDEGGSQHLPAASVERFASIKDCEAEGTGVYFALAGTERFARSNPNPEIRQLVNGETLFVNRQHSGQTSTVDQGIAIAPVDDDD